MVPSRWVHELYPVDEIFQRDLGIAKDAFQHRARRRRRRTSTPSKRPTPPARSSTRPRSPRRPSSASTSTSSPAGRASTSRRAGCRRRSTAQSAVDARIATDPERFWDHYQSKVLPRIYDNVMKVTDNRPLPDKQPFHRDLDIEVWMSEPDFRIGVDEELVSSLEVAARGSLLRHARLLRRARPHDDAARGSPRRARSSRSSTPIARGKAGQVAVLYAGNASTKPQIEICLQGKGRRAADARRRELAKIDTSPPLVAPSRRRARSRQRDRAADRAEGRSRGRPRRRRARRPGAAARRRPVQDRAVVSTTSTASRSHVGLKEVRARRVIASTGRRRASANVRTRVGEAADAARHVGSHHQPRRIRGDRRQPRGVPGGQGLQGGPFVSRPRHLGAGDHAADAERAGLAREADGVQADDLHHRPAARERGVVDQPHPPARRSCSPPTTATRTS